MSINMSMVISGSVGSNGRNNPKDVKVVQELLNRHIKPPQQFLAEDGQCGPKTRNAIVQFQRNAVGLKQPDGRVDPNGKTLRALNDPAAAQRWGGFSNGPVAVGAPPAATRFQGDMRKVFTDARNHS